MDADAVIDTDAIVDTWFVERIHNSPASRHSEVIALLLDAKDDLKRRLRDVAPAKPDPESEEE